MLGPTKIQHNLPSRKFSEIQYLIVEIPQSNGNDIISYVGEPTGTAGLGFGWQFLTFFILYNNLIPISLQVRSRQIGQFLTHFIVFRP